MTYQDLLLEVLARIAEAGKDPDLTDAQKLRKIREVKAWAESHFSQINRGHTNV